MFDFTTRKPIKCQNCGKEKGNHLAHTLECPKGQKTRIGYTSFGKTTWEPKARAALSQVEQGSKNG
jgi:hypothetical protein